MKKLLAICEDVAIKLEVYIPNPVEDLSSSIGLHIVTGGHHDKTKRQDEHHQREALWSTPDIKDFAKGSWKMPPMRLDIMEVVAVRECS